MSNLIFIRKAGPFGDCTYFYELKFNEKMTVKEFIKEVLSRKGEWGYINIGRRRLEYRYGNLLSGYWEDIKDREIVPISASGGWSSMDYKLNLTN